MVKYSLVSFCIVLIDLRYFVAFLCYDYGNGKSIELKNSKRGRLIGRASYALTPILEDSTIPRTETSHHS